MSFLNNMKVGKKMGLLILVAVVALGVVGFMAHEYFDKEADRLTVMYEQRLVPVEKLNDVRHNAQAVSASILELMLTTDNKRNEELKKTIAALVEKNNKNMAVFDKMPMDAKAKELLATVKDLQQKYRNARNEVIELAAQNKNAEAYARFAATVAPMRNAYTDSLNALSEHYVALSKKLDEESNAAEAQVSIMLPAIVTGVALLLCLIGWTITRAVTKPLRAMVEVCGELASGDFRDQPRKIHQTDEIGQLAEALVNMRTSVRQVLKHVSESAEQVAASSEELTASAEQSSQAVNQVAASITNVAQGSETTVTAAMETSAVVEQMSAGIQQIAASTNQVATNSAQASEKAKEGDASVGRAVSQMGSIEKTVNNSAQVVAKLGERSKEIGQIVDTISGIAGQTNLLALNAAIEAARAGEQGRGFAVVAEEVRKLAEQSQDAAKKIANLIGEIQGDTDKAVSAMNEGTREVKVGSDVVTAAGQAFREIAGLVLQVSDQVREISAAIQQMASGSQQIVRSVKEMGSQAKITSGETQTVSAATEEQSASMEEIASSSQALATLAQNLQAAVNKFRV